MHQTNECCISEIAYGVHVYFCYACILKLICLPWSVKKTAGPFSLQFLFPMTSGAQPLHHGFVCILTGLVHLFALLSESYKDSSVIVDVSLQMRCLPWFHNHLYCHLHELTSIPNVLNYLCWQKLIMCKGSVVRHCLKPVKVQLAFTWPSWLVAALGRIHKNKNYLLNVRHQSLI